MKKRIKFKFNNKYYGFLRKHTKMWWRKVEKKFVSRGIHPKVLYFGGGGVMAWHIKECPLIRFGAWIDDNIDKYTLFADWEALIDKFKPGRCPFEFDDVDSMINEAVNMIELYNVGGKTFNNYIRANSDWADNPNKDMLELIESESGYERRNGLPQEKWDRAFEERKEIIKKAMSDDNVWGVVLVARCAFFNNIPESLFIIIEDREDKISDKDWDAAWDTWGDIYDKVSIESNFNIEVRSKYDMYKYAHENHRRKRLTKTGRWMKGNFKDL